MDSYWQVVAEAGDQRVEAEAANLPVEEVADCPVGVEVLRVRDKAWWEEDTILLGLGEVLRTVLAEGVEEDQGKPHHDAKTLGRSS